MAGSTPSMSCVHQGLPRNVVSEWRFKLQLKHDKCTNQRKDKCNANEAIFEACLHVLCDVGSNMTKLQPWHLIFFPFWYLVLFFSSPARWGPLDFIRVASFSSSSSSGSCEFRDLSGHCRTSTASSEVSGHCRPPDPVGTAGPQLRADLSGTAGKLIAGARSQWALRTSTAASTASARSQRALGLAVPVPERMPE